MQKFILDKVVNRIYSGGTPSTDNPDFWGGNYKWLSSGETSQSFISDTISKITEEGIKGSSTKLAKRGNVVMACAGQGKTRGQVSYLLEDMYVNQSVIVLDPNEKYLDSLYLYYNLKGRYEELRGGSDASSTRGSITTKSLKKLPIFLPEISVQKKVSSVLSKYDELILNNSKRIKILEDMAEKIYKEWFVRFRFPGYEICEFENGIPKERKSVNLKSVLSKITTGLNPRKNFVLGEGENYYVTIKNMGDNNIYLDDKCDKVDDEAIKKINKRSDLKIGDILFSGIGTIGRVYLISIPTHNWNVSESVFTMRANDKVSKEYLYMLLLSDNLQNFCSSHAQGVAQPGIRMAELESYKFRLPTKNIIDSFTNYISPIINTIQNLRKQNDILTKQRDFLLPRLMSGKLEFK